MKNFVITCGYDCDGGYSARIDKYVTEELAAAVAQSSNESSDGIGYGIADESEARHFAEETGVKMPDYTFDENQEIIPDNIEVEDRAKGHPYPGHEIWPNEEE